MSKCYSSIQTFCNLFEKIILCELLEDWQISNLLRCKGFLRKQVIFILDISLLFLIYWSEREKGKKTTKNYYSSSDLIRVFCEKRDDCVKNLTSIYSTFYLSVVLFNVKNNKLKKNLN